MKGKMDDRSKRWKLKIKEARDLLHSVLMKVSRQSKKEAKETGFVAKLKEGVIAADERALVWIILRQPSVKNLFHFVKISPKL
jgi:hypothetical protein